MDSIYIQNEVHLYTFLFHWCTCIPLRRVRTHTSIHIFTTGVLPAKKLENYTETTRFLASRYSPVFNQEWTYKVSVDDVINNVANPRSRERQRFTCTKNSYYQPFRETLQQDYETLDKNERKMSSNLILPGEGLLRWRKWGCLKDLGLVLIWRRWELKWCLCSKFDLRLKTLVSTSLLTWLPSWHFGQNGFY